MLFIISDNGIDKTKRTITFTGSQKIEVTLNEDQLRNLLAAHGVKNPNLDVLEAFSVGDEIYKKTQHDKSSQIVKLEKYPYGHWYLDEDIESSDFHGYSPKSLVRFRNTKNRDSFAKCIYIPAATVQYIMERSQLTFVSQGHNFLDFNPRVDDSVRRPNVAAFVRVLEKEIQKEERENARRLFTHKVISNAGGKIVIAPLNPQYDGEGRITLKPADITAYSKENYLRNGKKYTYKLDNIGEEIPYPILEPSQQPKNDDKKEDGPNRNAPSFGGGVSSAVENMFDNDPPSPQRSDSVYGPLPPSILDKDESVTGVVVNLDNTHFFVRVLEKTNNKVGNTKTSDQGYHYKVRDEIIKIPRNPKYQVEQGHIVSFTYNVGKDIVKDFKFCSDKPYSFLYIDKVEENKATPELGQYTYTLEDNSIGTCNYKLSKGILLADSGFPAGGSDFLVLDGLLRTSATFTGLSTAKTIHISNFPSSDPGDSKQAEQSTGPDSAPRRDFGDLRTNLPNRGQDQFNIYAQTYGSAANHAQPTTVAPTAAATGDQKASATAAPVDQPQPAPASPELNPAPAPVVQPSPVIAPATQIVAADVQAAPSPTPVQTTPTPAETVQDRKTDAPAPTQGVVTVDQKTVPAPVADTQPNNDKKDDATPLPPDPVAAAALNVSVNASQPAPTATNQKTGAIPNGPSVVIAELNNPAPDVSASAQASAATPRDDHKNSPTSITSSINRDDLPEGNYKVKIDELSNDIQMYLIYDKKDGTSSKFSLGVDEKTQHSDSLRSSPDIKKQHIKYESESILDRIRNFGKSRSPAIIVSPPEKTSNEYQYYMDGTVKGADQAFLQKIVSKGKPDQYLLLDFKTIGEEGFIDWNKMDKTSFVARYEKTFSYKEDDPIRLHKFEVFWPQKGFIIIPHQDYAQSVGTNRDLLIISRKPGDEPWANISATRSTTSLSVKVSVDYVGKILRGNKDHHTFIFNDPDNNGVKTLLNVASKDVPENVETLKNLIYNPKTKKIEEAIPQASSQLSLDSNDSKSAAPIQIDTSPAPAAAAPAMSPPNAPTSTDTKTSTSSADAKEEWTKAPNGVYQVKITDTGFEIMSGVNRGKQYELENLPLNSQTPNSKVGDKVIFQKTETQKATQKIPATYSCNIYELQEFNSLGLDEKSTLISNTPQDSDHYIGIYKGKHNNMHLVEVFRSGGQGKSLPTSTFIAITDKGEVIDPKSFVSVAIRSNSSIRKLAIEDKGTPLPQDFKDNLICLGRNDANSAYIFLYLNNNNNAGIIKKYEFVTNDTFERGHEYYCLRKNGVIIEFKDRDYSDSEMKSTDKGDAKHIVGGSEISLVPSSAPTPTTPPTASTSLSVGCYLAEKLDGGQFKFKIPDANGDLKDHVVTNLKLGRTEKDFIVVVESQAKPNSLIFKPLKFKSFGLAYDKDSKLTGPSHKGESIHFLPWTASTFQNNTKHLLQYVGQEDNTFKFYIRDQAKIHYILIPKQKNSPKFKHEEFCIGEFNNGIWTCQSLKKPTHHDKRDVICIDEGQGFLAKRKFVNLNEGIIYDSITLYADGITPKFGKTYEYGQGRLGLPSNDSKDAKTAHTEASGKSTSPDQSSGAAQAASSNAQQAIASASVPVIPIQPPQADQTPIVNFNIDKDEKINMRPQADKTPSAQPARPETDTTNDSSPIIQSGAAPATAPVNPSAPSSQQSPNAPAGDSKTVTAEPAPVQPAAAAPATNSGASPSTPSPASNTSATDSKAAVVISPAAVTTNTQGDQKTENAQPAAASGSTPTQATPAPTGSASVRPRGPAVYDRPHRQSSSNPNSGTVVGVTWSRERKNAAPKTQPLPQPMQSFIDGPSVVRPGDPAPSSNPVIQPSPASASASQSLPGTSQGVIPQPSPKPTPDAPAPAAAASLAGPQTAPQQPASGPVNPSSGLPSNNSKRDNTSSVNDSAPLNSGSSSAVDDKTSGNVVVKLVDNSRRRGIWVQIIYPNQSEEQFEIDAGGQVNTSLNQLLNKKCAVMKKDQGKWVFVSDPNLDTKRAEGHRILICAGPKELLDPDSGRLYYTPGGKYQPGKKYSAYVVLKGKQLEIDKIQVALVEDDKEEEWYIKNQNNPIVSPNTLSPGCYRVKITYASDGKTGLPRFRVLAPSSQEHIEYTALNSTKTPDRGEECWLVKSTTAECQFIARDEKPTAYWTDKSKELNSIPLVRCVATTQEYSRFEIISSSASSDVGTHFYIHSDSIANTGIKIEESEFYKFTRAPEDQNKKFTLTGIKPGPTDRQNTAEEVVYAGIKDFFNNKYYIDIATGQYYRNPDFLAGGDPVIGQKYKLINKAIHTQDLKTQVQIPAVNVLSSDDQKRTNSRPVAGTDVKSQNPAPTSSASGLASSPTPAASPQAQASNTAPAQASQPPQSFPLNALDSVLAAQALRPNSQSRLPGIDEKYESSSNDLFGGVGQQLFAGAGDFSRENPMFSDGDSKRDNSSQTLASMMSLQPSSLTAHVGNGSQLLPHPSAPRSSGTEVSMFDDGFSEEVKAVRSQFANPQLILDTTDSNSILSSTLPPSFRTSPKGSSSTALLGSSASDMKSEPPALASDFQTDANLSEMVKGIDDITEFPVGAGGVLRLVQFYEDTKKNLAIFEDINTLKQYKTNPPIRPSDLMFVETHVKAGGKKETDIYIVKQFNPQLLTEDGWVISLVANYTVSSKGPQVVFLFSSTKKKNAFCMPIAVKDLKGDLNYEGSIGYRVDIQFDNSDGRYGVTIKRNVLPLSHGDPGDSKAVDRTANPTPATQSSGAVPTSNSGVVGSSPSASSAANPSPTPAGFQQDSKYASSGKVLEQSKRPPQEYIKNKNIIQDNELADFKGQLIVKYIGTMNKPKGRVRCKVIYPSEFLNRELQIQGDDPAAKDLQSNKPAFGIVQKTNPVPQTGAWAGAEAGVGATEACGDEDAAGPETTEVAEAGTGAATAAIAG